MQLIYKILPVLFVLMSTLVQANECAQIDTNDIVVDTFAVRVDVSWKDNPSINRYDIEYGIKGFVRGSGTAIDSIVTNEQTISSLSENAFYDFYITSICNNGDTSDVAGPISFKTLWKIDLGIIAILRPDPFEKCNFSQTDTVKVLIKNFGANPQTYIPFDVSINGENSSASQPTDGVYSGVIGRYGVGAIDMEVEWELSESGNYHIVAWTQMKDDGDPSNDTFKFDFISIYDNPFYQTFEDLALPDRWNTEEKENPVYPAGHHGNSSATLSDHLNAVDTVFKVETSRVKIRDGETQLKFDISLRIGNTPAEPYSLQTGDVAELFISTDCGENFELFKTLTDFPTITTTMNFDLSEYIDQSVNFKFKVRSTNGNDFWVDYDNINMYECRDSLALTHQIVIEGESRELTVIPNFGFEPYQYEWTNGDITPTVVRNDEGHYTVTVTDAGGCTDEITINVWTVSTSEVDPIRKLSIFPNPANEYFTLKLGLAKENKINIQIFDIIGNLRENRSYNSAQKLDTKINLSNYQSGIYFLVIEVDGQRKISRIIIEK